MVPDHRQALAEARSQTACIAGGGNHQGIRLSRNASYKNKADQRDAVLAGAGELAKELGIGMKPRVRFTS